MVLGNSRRFLSSDIVLVEGQQDLGGGARASLPFVNLVCQALHADPKNRYRFLPPLTQQEEAVKFAEQVLSAFVLSIRCYY